MFRRDKFESVIDERTRSDLKKASDAVIKEYEKNARTTLKPCEPKQLVELKKPSRLETFIKKRRMALGIGGAVVGLGSVIGFLAYYENSTAEQSLKHDRQQAIEKVLQNPDDLKVLDICQESLRGEALFHTGSLKQLYNQAAAMEDKLHFDCNDISTNANVDALIVVLPLSGEIKISVDDIIPIRSN